MFTFLYKMYKIMLIKLVKHNLDAIFACLTALKVHFCLSVSACK